MDDNICEIQKIALGILKDVIGLCEKLDIPYYVTEGSCLGTVRHKGFIPWDDDIDIAIPAECYEKFINEGRKLLPEKYLIKGAFEQEIYPEHTDVITKVFDTKIWINANLFDRKDIVEHPWIDVSLICGLPDGVVKSKIHFFHILMVKALLKLSNKESIGFNSSKKRGRLEKMFLKIVKKINTSKIFDEGKQSVNMKKVLLKYGMKESRNVVAFTSDYRWKEIMPKEIYGKGVKMKFEDLAVVIPEKYDYYLKQLYGNYMQLPPEEERQGKHHVEILKYK